MDETVNLSKKIKLNTSIDGKKKAPHANIQEPLRKFTIEKKKKKKWLSPKINTGTSWEANVAIPTVIPGSRDTHTALL